MIKIDLYLPEKLNMRIMKKLERIDELEALAQSFGSLSSFGPRVKTSERYDGGFENTVVKIVECKTALNGLRVQKELAEAEICEVLARLPEKSRDVLFKRHIELQGILEIAEHYGRSYRTIQRWLAEARKEFNRELQ